MLAANDDLKALKDDNARLRLCRDRWRFKAYLAWAVVACLIVGSGAFWIGQRTAPQVESDGLRFVGQPRIVESSQVSSPHVLASVWFNGCSGTIVSKGERLARVISVAHGFDASRIGQTYWMAHPNGKWVGAILERVDHQHDLAELICGADDVLGVTPVAEENEAPEAYEICGYPDGKGPSLSHLASGSRTTAINGNQWRWQFTHKDGFTWYGSSGCGIFAGGMLVGVESHIDPSSQGRVFYCCAHRDLKKFVAESKRNRDCGNGVCQLPPSPPPDAAPPAPGEGTPAPAPKNPPGAPKWKPSVPVNIPYAGKIPMPDKVSTQHIIALEKRIDTLQEMVDLLASTAPKQGEPGPRGLPGPAGRDGKDGAPGPQGIAGTPGKDAAGAFDPSGLQKQIDDLSKAIAAIKPGTPTDLSGIQNQIAVIQGTLAAGIKVQILDSTKAVVDEDTYPINGPIKIQKITKTNPQGVASNGK